MRPLSGLQIPFQPPYTESVILVAAAGDAGRRLDRVLRKALPDAPLSALYALLRRGFVVVDGKKAAAADRVYPGARIVLEGFERRTERARKERGAPLSGVLFEGAGLLAVNKPAGLAVHGPDRDNLASRVRAYLEGRVPPSLSFTPGPLHRLDKPSSGVVVFGAESGAAREFSSLLRAGKIRKTYLAILEGRLERGETWEDFLERDAARRKTFVAASGQRALTRVRPLAAAPSLTLAALEIETGRTHQIRAQAAFHGCPLWKDGKYGAGGGGFFLHALSLEMGEIPEVLRGFPRLVTAPLPGEFERAAGKNFGDVSALIKRESGR